MSTWSGRVTRIAAVVVVTAALGIVAGATPAVGAPGAPKPPTLRVLVTNDDGVAAPGIDALVQASASCAGSKSQLSPRPTTRAGRVT